MTYQFDFGVVWSEVDRLLLGAGSTLLLSVAAMVVGFLLAVVVVLMRSSRHRVPARIAGGYVQVVRNTPFLIQIYFIYFGLPSVGVPIGSNVAAVAALSMNFAAYASEILRGGLRAIPRGQTDAGLALGLTPLETFLYVVLKPAVKKTYPALVSQFIMLMLMSSIASSVAAIELTYIGQQIELRTYRSFEVYFTITALYLAMSMLLSVLFDLLRQVLFRYPDA